MNGWNQLWNDSKNLQSELWTCLPHEAYMHVRHSGCSDQLGSVYAKSSIW